MLRYRFLLLLPLLLLPVLDAGAVPRNPPPVFETEYTLPDSLTKTPTAASLTAENFILAALYALMLLVAGLAVHRWRSRKILFCLAAVSVTLFGFVQNGCPCPVGMLQNITAAVIQPAAFVPWTAVILFLLPLFAALFWGRIFCSSVCPFGAVQELTAVKNLRVPESVEHVLGLLRYLYLGLGVCCVAVGLGYYICRFDPYIGFFRFGGLLPIMLFSIAVLVTGMIIGRPFCRFLCPYGALLGLFASLASRKVSVTPGDCTNCQLCENVCPYNAVLPPSPIPNETEKRRGLQQLLLSFLLFPILIIGFGILGYYVAPKLAPLHHTVKTAALIYAEEQKLVALPGSFSETHAVMLTGESNGEIYQQALQVIQRFRITGIGFGIWCGLVIGLKLVVLSLHRRRLEYSISPSRCYACGRCFWYCPNQKNERILLDESDSRRSEKL